jgi:acetylornithine deacetylase
MILRSIFAAALGWASITIAQQAPLKPSQDTQTTPLLPEDASKQLLSLHRDLVKISSITGKEAGVGRWLASYLRSQNYSVELQQVTPHRYNVFAYGSKRNTSILVSSHIDTVPPYWPYGYNKTTNVIRGRGSVDAKGSVAAQIVAVQEIREKLQDEISLLFVVGEETGGDGMRHFSENDPHAQGYDIVVFGEPTEGKLVCGHKGIMQVNVKATGKAAHSGYPWLGVSANDILIEALAKLLAIRDTLPSSEKYGNTTVNFGRLEGGVAGNVVAETASANIAIRLAAGTPQEVRKTLIAALSDIKAKAQSDGGDLDLDWEIEGYGPVDIDCDLAGFKTMTVNYGTDIPNLKGGHRKYLYGPGSIFVAHSDHEALQRRDLEQAVLDYRKLIVGAVVLKQERENAWSGTLDPELSSGVEG